VASEEYWNQNIREWGKFYLGISHSGESLKGVSPFVSTYKATIGRHEARLMKTRYEATMGFLRHSITEGCVFADLGCGTGIFTVAALRLGANVIAVDFSETALATTRHDVNFQIPEYKNRVTYLKLDIRSQKVPASDVSLAVGLVPYVENITEFFNNALANTNSALVSWVSETSPFNRIRRKFSFLNVRNLMFHNTKDVDECWRDHGFSVGSRQRLGTGFIDIASRKEV
jgi:cyclopropane fatty-acyl-phospholipid synthase-like methyltransferase